MPINENTIRRKLTELLRRSRTFFRVELQYVQILLGLLVYEATLQLSRLFLFND